MVSVEAQCLVSLLSNRFNKDTRPCVSDNRSIRLYVLEETLIKISQKLCHNLYVIAFFIKFVLFLYKMSLILSIETSATICSVALHKKGVLLDTFEDHTPNSHSAVLTVLIEKLLEKQKRNINQIDAVALSIGPGSYTGLRIGASVAKGIAFGANIPIVAVSSLKIIAKSALSNNSSIEPDALICPMIDARRMEVYSALYSVNLEMRNEVESIVIDENSFKDFLKDNKIYFCGNGAEKCKEIIVGSNAIFIDDTYASAKEMGELAFEKFKNNEFEDVAYFEPFYLKNAAVTKPKPYFQ